MPNYTWTTLKAPKKVISELTNGGKGFSFNTLIPMPKELEHTLSGGNTCDLLGLYIIEHCAFKEYNEIRKDAECFMFSPEFETKKEYENYYLSRLNGGTYNETVDEETGERYRFTGKDYYNLYKKYGAVTWYDWRCKNWGTKWDCWDVDITEDCIRYTTAWCDALGILNAICEKYPEAEIKIESEYEDNYLVRWTNCNGSLCLVDEFERDYSEIDWENDDICEYEETHPWISLKTKEPIDTKWL